MLARLMAVGIKSCSRNEKNKDSDRHCGYDKQRQVNKDKSKS